MHDIQVVTERKSSPIWQIPENTAFVPVVPITETSGIPMPLMATAVNRILQTFNRSNTLVIDLFTSEIYLRKGVFDYPVSSKAVFIFSKPMVQWKKTTMTIKPEIQENIKFSLCANKSEQIKTRNIKFSSIKQK